MSIRRLAMAALVLLLSMRVHAQATGDPLLYAVSRGDGTVSLRLVDSVSGEIIAFVTLSETDSYTGWSPDGRYIHLVEEAEPGLRSLRIYDRETGTLYPITDTQIFDPCQAEVYWSPRSDAFVYRTRQDNGHEALLIVNPDGTGARVLEPSDEGYTPLLWSADGRFVARDSVDASAGGVQRYAIWEAATGRLVTMTPLGEAKESAWSPTGARFVLYNSSAHESYIFDDAAAVVTTITAGEVRFWSPDSELLGVYLQRNAILSTLKLITVDGATMWESLEIEVYADRPMWSPDSRWLAFAGSPLRTSKPLAASGDPEEHATIYVFDRETLSTRIVSPDAPANVRFLWSPDSQTLVFGGTVGEVSDDFNFELASLWWYDVVSATTQLVELERPMWRSRDYTPEWSQDSRYLLYFGEDGFSYFDRQLGTVDFIGQLPNTFRWFPGADPLTFEAAANRDDLVVIGPDGKARNLTNTPNEREIFLGWAGDQNPLNSLHSCGVG